MDNFVVHDVILRKIVSCAWDPWPHLQRRLMISSSHPLSWAQTMSSFRPTRLVIIGKLDAWLNMLGCPRMSHGSRITCGYERPPGAPDTHSPFPHSAHRYSRMLSCTRMCSFSISFLAKDFPHCSQAWLFTPVNKHSSAGKP